MTIFNGIWGKSYSKAAYSHGYIGIIMYTKFSIVQLRLFVNGAKVVHSITYECTNYLMVKKLPEGGMYICCNGYHNKRKLKT